MSYFLPILCQETDRFQRFSVKKRIKNKPLITVQPTEKVLEKHCNTPDRRQSKTLLTIEERGSKIARKVFSISICRPTGDKWQSEALFLTFYDLRASIVLKLVDGLHVQAERPCYSYHILLFKCRLQNSAISSLYVCHHVKFY